MSIPINPNTANCATKHRSHQSPHPNKIKREEGGGGRTGTARVLHRENGVLGDLDILAEESEVGAVGREDGRAVRRRAGEELGGGVGEHARAGDGGWEEGEGEVELAEEFREDLFARAGRHGFLERGWEG